MLQVIQQTREERVAMYMKLSKRELIEMLLNNQNLVSHQQERLLNPIYSIQPGWARVTRTREPLVKAAEGE